MKHKDITDKLSLYLDGSLSSKEVVEIENKLKDSEELRNQLAEIESFLKILDAEKMETPSARLKANFDTMLAQEIQSNQHKVVQLEPKQDWKLYLRVAASIVMVISAFLFGKYQSNITKIANAKEENQKEVLAMLENTSASQRILAVNKAETYSKQDAKIIQAIINRLLFDKNANVRLAAAEALTKFSSESMVREALLKSLETEKNATVQIELIHILAKIQEKRAIKPMEKILANEEIPEFVKQEVQINLPTLL